MAQSEPGDVPESKQIAWLRRLVLAMTVTMIAGVIVLVGLALSVFLKGGSEVSWPQDLAIPQGESVQAITRSTNWIAVVTKDAEGRERIHILDQSGQERRQTVAIR